VGPLPEADASKPTPDPAAWRKEPAAQGETRIAMEAMKAHDARGVEYHFEERTGHAGATDSGWQASPRYVDEGLEADSEYRYRVRVRDRSSAQNTTAWSEEIAVRTPPPDLSPPEPDPAKWLKPPHQTGPGTLSMDAAPATDPSGVQYFFEEMTGNPGGDASGWQDSPNYEDSGLESGKTYRYRVRTRDQSPAQNESEWSPEERFEVQDMNTLADEDFDDLPLQPAVDRPAGDDPSAGVFSPTPPHNWTVDDTRMADQEGCIEFAGWSFVDRAYWDSVAPGQDRLGADRLNGVIAVADSDEFHDCGGGGMNTILRTRPIHVPAGHNAVVRFVNDYRHHGSTIGIFGYKLNSGDFTTLDEFREDERNQLLAFPLGASGNDRTYVFSWHYANEQPGADGRYLNRNDWWWAIDNFEVLSTLRGGGGAALPLLSFLTAWP
jgi:hypothetical protein